MEAQRDMFSARRARDDAIESVTRNSADWMQSALVAISKIQRGTEVIGEDIRIMIRDKVGDPHHHNAWGALIKSAIRNGLLIQTDRFRQMKTTKSHARVSRIYRLS